MPGLQNWRIESARGICRLTLDMPGRSHNVLSSAVIAELDTALDEIEAAAPAALLVTSAKARGFIAGADVGEFSAIDNAQQAAAHVAAAHKVFGRLQALSPPSVALINGHCLGGGLELALACDYRVACDSPSIRIGLPEVKLGIHPGFGGVARLIETIGVLPAMEAMLSGRRLSPAAAGRLGLIDFAVPMRQLERTAHYVVESKTPPRRRRIAASQKILNRALLPAPMRRMAAGVLRKKISARVNPHHYPAPYRLIDLWRQHGGSRADLLKAEQESVAQLITTPTARNLARVFFLREALGKSGDHGGDAESFEHVHVIGAGVMGGDIAAWCALRGLTVTLHDRDLGALAAANRRAADRFKGKLKSRRRVQRALDRFRPDPAGHGARRADVIIEAIAEDADAKIAVFAELQKIARPDALLATNTSSIPLETLGAALSPEEDWPQAQRDGAHPGYESLIAPNRLVGLHFFNPVAKMQLVEIVSAPETRADVARRAAAFARRIGRLPVAVKSGPGFLVNRILTPYLLEAVELLGEGVAAARIDRAATDFGMLMGPVAIADTVGLDICLRVAQNLVGGHNGAVPEMLRRQVEKGRLGKKSGRGFYRWSAGRPRKGAAGIHTRVPPGVQDRLILRCLNEAVACLHEGVVEHPDSLDAALIFGAGFAPFRGGPLHYIAEQGRETLLSKLTALEAQHGARFKPSEGWRSG